MTALRTSLEILFDTDLEQRPALETLETETPPARAYSDWDRNGEGAGVDWVTSDRVTSVRAGGRPLDSADARTDESAIIDVPEEPLLPPRSTGACPVSLRRPARRSLPARTPGPVSRGSALRA